MNTRAIAIAFVVVGIIVGVVTFARKNHEAASEVRTVKAVRKGITSRVVAQGKVRAKTQVDVSSEVAGRVAEVSVDVGDVVDKGAMLFALDGEQLRVAVDQLQAAIAQAEAVLARSDVAVSEAERAAARDKTLFDKGVLADDVVKLTESRLLTARAERASAQANVERTRIDLHRAKDALKRAKVTAPMAGTVVAVGVEVGRVVTSGTGLSASPDAALGLGIGGASAPVIIADLSELLVKLDVDELDVSRVHAGQPAVIKAQGIKDLDFIGVVEKVGLLGRDAMGAVLFTVELRVTGSRPVDGGNAGGAAGDDGAAPIVPAPADVLRPGMSAQAEIDVEHRDDVVVVPVSAVLEAGKTDDGPVPDRVVVVSGGEGTDAVLTAAVRPITLGPSEGDVISVVKGLDAGEVVVEGPYRVLKLLKDGDKVTREPEKKAPAK